MATIVDRRRAAGRSELHLDQLFEELWEASDEERTERLHERAWRELESGRSRRGLYAIALTGADGDRGRAEAGYLRRRVVQLEDQFDLWSRDREEEEAEVQRREEASADFARTLFAMGLLVLAVIAIMAWT